MATTTETPARFLTPEQRIVTPRHRLGGLRDDAHDGGRPPHPLDLRPGRPGTDVAVARP